MTVVSSLFPRLSRDEARLLSPLQLAYVGDSVHALLVRSYLIRRGLLVKDMHDAANRVVSAVSQYHAMQALLPLLTPEEEDIARRGRNAHPHHGAPKSASVGEYAGATGLEALLGYLFLTGQEERLHALLPYILPDLQAEDSASCQKNNCL